MQARPPLNRNVREPSQIAREGGQKGCWRLRTGSAELSAHQRPHADQILGLNWDYQKAKKGVQIDRKRRRINVIEMCYTPTAETV